MECDLHGWPSRLERVGLTRGPATYRHLCACSIAGIRWCGGAGVWGKVRACLLHGAGMAMNLGPELHSRWRAPQLAESLWAGGVVACPAEGVWGLSCDPFDEGAVLDLLAMKQREVSKGLIVVGASSDVFADVLSDLSSEQRGSRVSAGRRAHSGEGPRLGIIPSCLCRRV